MNEEQGKKYIYNNNIILALARFAARGDVKRSRYQIERLKKRYEESGETKFAEKLDKILNPPKNTEEFTIINHDNYTLMMEVNELLRKKECVKTITREEVGIIGESLKRGLVSASLVCRKLDEPIEYVNSMFEICGLPYKIEL